MVSITLRRPQINLQWTDAPRQHATSKLTPGGPHLRQNMCLTIWTLRPFAVVQCRSRNGWTTASDEARNSPWAGPDVGTIQGGKTLPVPFCLLHW